MPLDVQMDEIAQVSRELAATYRNGNRKDCVERIIKSGGDTAYSAMLAIMVYSRIPSADRGTFLTLIDNIRVQILAAYERRTTDRDCDPDIHGA